jgi:uncharacterized protein
VSFLGWLRSHPVTGYYGLTFLISWGGLLAIVGPANIPGSADDVERLFPLALIALFAGPSVAGLTMTAAVSGRAGLQELRARLFRWRVGPRWWCAALLTGPLLVAAILFGLASFSPVYTPGIITTEEKAALLALGLGWGLVGGGFLEELGWTGFAVPALRRRHGALGTGLIVGALWGCWHLLIAAWASRALAGESPLAGFVGGFLAFYLIALPAYRVLMVRVHDRTGSLLVAMLMHAVLSASTLILQPGTASGNLTWNLMLAASLWVVVGMTSAADRG